MLQRIVLFLIFFVCVFSAIIIFLILSYIDPFVSNKLVVFSLLISIFLLIATFFTLAFYLFKKIHFRGQVYMIHISSSFRQGVFIASFVIIVWVFKRLGVPLLLSSGLLFISIFFLELFINNVFQ